MHKWVFSLGAFVTLSTGICSAEEYDKFLLFGDSYFDTGAGNRVAEEAGVPLVSPTPPYFHNRHSNGRIWIDYTRRDLDMCLEDYAVAGAETGFGNANIGPEGPTNPLGGLFQQLGRFEAKHNHINDNTIVVVDGAANNLLALLSDPSRLNPEGIAQTVEQALTDLGTVVLPGLQQLGAEKIVLWNLGDLGILPLFNSDIFVAPSPFALFPNKPTQEAVKGAMTAGSIGFNEALPGVIQQLNGGGFKLLTGFGGEQQIFIFDAFTEFNVLVQELVDEGVDLTEFAFISNYGGPYIPTGQPPEEEGFYDPVHPNTKAWKLFSEITSAYFDTLMNAPRFMASQVDLVFETSQAHRDLIDNHFRTLHEERYIYGLPCNNCCEDDCSSMRDNFCDYGLAPNCFQVYFDAEGKWGSTKSKRGQFGLDYDTQVGMLGLDFRFNKNVTLGVAFSAQKSFAKVKDHRNVHHKGHMDLYDYMPTIYGTYYCGCLFADVAVTGHFNRFKHIKRHIPFRHRNTHGKRSAKGLELNFDAGFVTSCGRFTLMPVVGFDFQQRVLSNYKEHGGGFVNMKTHHFYQRSFIAKVGAQAFFSFFDGCTLAFAEFEYGYECLRDGRLMGPKFVNSNDGAKDYNHTSAPKRNIIKYSVGLDSKIGSCIVGNISYVGETNFERTTNGVRAEIDYAF